MQLTEEQKELCRRLREDIDVHDADAIAAADLIEALAAHTAGAQEPERCKCCGYLVTESEHMGCLRATQPMMTDDARDALNRLRRKVVAARERYQEVSPFVSAPWMVKGEVLDLIDDEINRLDRAKGE